MKMLPVMRLIRRHKRVGWGLLALSLLFLLLNIRLGLKWSDRVLSQRHFIPPADKGWRESLGNAQQHVIRHESLDYIPPLLSFPPQEKNQFKSFKQQVIDSNLNAYQASPPLNRNNNSNRLLHYIFVSLDDSAGNGQFVSFNLMDYLVIRSAYFRLEPDEIYLHLSKPPLDPCPYWHLIHPMIAKVVLFESITEIFGHKVSGAAHVSDIKRLQVLQQYGGMYMDIDSLSLRPFPEKYWNPPSGLMMGTQNKKQSKIGVGVIVARPDSPFLRRWLQSYKSFDDTKWDQHTVVMAGKLARKYPSEIDIAPMHSFYYPSWVKKSFHLLWAQRPMDQIDLYDFQSSYAPHFWGTIARNAGYIQRLTPDTIVDENSGINQILRPLLPMPFFSILIDCTNWTPELLQDTIRTIQSQTFSMYEVLLKESAKDRSCRHYFESQVGVSVNLDAKQIGYIPSILIDAIETYARGIWLVSFQVGERFHSRTALNSALELMRESVQLDLIHVPNEKPIRFIFNSSQPIQRVKNITTTTS